MKTVTKNTTPIIREVPVLETNPETGLDGTAVLLRQQSGLSNGITQSATRTVKEIFAENLLTFFNLIFIVLAVLLVIAGSSVKNMTFLGVMVCNIAIGCYQEIRAKRAVDKLTLVAAQQLRTVRDGKIVMIRSDLLVRDDIVEFMPGDQICADAIVCTGRLLLNESLITGEEDPVEKMTGDVLRSGSFVIAGNGRVRLTGVGADGYAARLAAEAKADPHATKSGMMLSLDRLIRGVGIILIPVGLLLFYQEFKSLQLPFRDSVEGTVAALVGMIPEGLYLLTSVAMAASALVLARRKVLVQDMNCIETLARVDVLCVDKTGTITEAAMEVDDVVSLTQDPPERLEMILAAFYAGDEHENETGRAMAEVFARDSDWVCTHRIPFTSEQKWSAAAFQGHGAFVVGAPEFMLGERFEEYRDDVEQWAGAGYRVLMVAQYGADISERLEPGKLTPLALVLLTNRIRKEAPKTFQYFVEQGVTVKVISGDDPLTVSEVARRAGIPNAQDYVDASHLKTEEDYLDAVEKYTVFGRVTPEQKKSLIKALKKRKHTVAMTGDGVNDVLALKEADCGIAMASGAQAATQIARIVLLKSDFSTMPGIVDEGRRVINNIQRAATLFLVKNIFSMGLALISLFTIWPYPAEPIHLSMISTLTIGVPSFFLAMEPNYERVKGRFLLGVLRRALPGGLTNIYVVLMAQAFMAVFGMDVKEIYPVCAAILGIVGLLVLYQTSKPFDVFRCVIWFAMAICLAVCFLFMPGFFELHVNGWRTGLVMLVLILMTPTVFFALQRFCDWCDKIIVALIRKARKRKYRYHR
ncbi:MAG: HAD-IC family P-type ATPase [Oscillospiraceae bacterium]|nr:HAD-IC family P-type ATPase [Oscillospiraceae bacterium]